MGIFDNVADKVKEKASRLAIDVERKREVVDEAQARLDAGRQTLTALLDPNANAVRAQADALQNQGTEAVGKITRVISEIAPTLRSEPGRVRDAINQLESAGNQLRGGAGDVERVAGNVERTMAGLLESANIPTNVMPRNLMSDLVADQRAQNQQGQTPTETTSDPRRGNSQPAPAAAGTANARTPATTPSNRGSATGSGRAADGRRGRPQIAELARSSGFLSAFGSLGGGSVAAVTDRVRIGDEGVTINGSVGQGIDGSVTIGRDGVSADATATRGDVSATGGVQVGREGVTGTGGVSVERGGASVGVNAEIGRDGVSVNGEASIDWNGITAGVTADRDGVEASAGPGNAGTNILGGAVGALLGTTGAPSSNSDASATSGFGGAVNALLGTSGATSTISTADATPDIGSLAMDAVGALVPSELLTANPVASVLESLRDVRALVTNERDGEQGDNRDGPGQRRQGAEGKPAPTSDATTARRKAPGQQDDVPSNARPANRPAPSPEQPTPQRGGSSANVPAGPIGVALDAVGSYARNADSLVSAVSAFRIDDVDGDDGADDFEIPDPAQRDTPRPIIQSPGGPDVQAGQPSQRPRVRPPRTAPRPAPGGGTRLRSGDGATARPARPAGAPPASTATTATPTAETATSSSALDATQPTSQPASQERTPPPLGPSAAPPRSEPARPDQAPRSGQQQPQPSRQPQPSPQPQADQSESDQPEQTSRRRGMRNLASIFRRGLPIQGATTRGLREQARQLGTNITELTATARTATTAVSNRPLEIVLRTNGINGIVGDTTRPLANVLDNVSRGVDPRANVRSLLAPIIGPTTTDETPAPSTETAPAPAQPSVVSAPDSASPPVAAPATSQRPATTSTEEGATDLVGSAQQRIQQVADSGGNIDTVVADEQRRVQTDQETRTQQEDVRGQREQTRQQRRQQRAGRRGQGARGAATRGAGRRRGQAQQRQVRTLATARAEFAVYRQQQLDRIANLQQIEQERIRAELQTQYEAELAAAQLERTTTNERIATERTALETDITNGKLEAERSRVERDTELVTIHRDAVREAREAERTAIAASRTLSSEGARTLRATGATEARGLRDAARSEAAELTATGRRLAAAARSNVPSGGTPEERRAATSQARARGAAINSDYANRASARIAEGNTDATATIADYERQATELIDRCNQAIEVQRRLTTDQIGVLDGNLVTDRAGLVTERDLWNAGLDRQLVEFTTRVTRELQEAETYYQAQVLVADREHRERFQAAVRLMLNDLERNRADLERQVHAQLNAMQARLDRGTQADLAAIDRDLETARGAIETQVARVRTRSDGEIQAFAAGSQRRVQAIATRGQQARDAIGRMATAARNGLAEVNNASQYNMRMRVQRAGDRTQRQLNNLRDDLSYETDNAALGNTAEGQRARAERQGTLSRRNYNDRLQDNAYGMAISAGNDARDVRPNNNHWQALDRDNTERYRVGNDDSYRLRRFATTGEVEISAANVYDIQTQLQTATRGMNNNSQIFQTLGTRTPEELRILFADGDFRASFMSELSAGNRAVVQQMIDARSPERIRALALHWAAEGGSGIGTDNDVMRRVFAASTNDAERAELDRQFQGVDGATRRDRNGRTIDQMIESETSWSTTRSSDRAVLRAQQGGNQTDIAAAETVAAYEGGGYFGIGTDNDSALRIRNDIRRRFAGPFRTPEEAEQARRNEAEALGRFDTTVRAQTGRSLAELDTHHTNGAVEQALAGSTRTVQVPVDPGNPNGPQRPEFRPDWVEFRTRVAESGSGSDYDTRRVEMAYNDSTPDERRAINARFASNHNGMTYQQYVMQNMGVTRRTDPETGIETESTNSAAPIDRRAVLELASDGELRSDTLILQAQYGRGRGTAEDQASIERRLGTLSDEDLRTLRTDYSQLVDTLGMRQSQTMTTIRQYVHAMSISGMPNLMALGWGTEQVLDTVSGPTGDIILDLRSTGTDRQHMRWGYLLTNGRADTPAEQMALDNHMLRGMGPAPQPGTFGSWLEGWEGRSARQQAAILRQQYARLQSDGTANLTPADATRLLMTQRESGAITQEQFEARMQRLGQFDQQANMSRIGQDATVAGRVATVRTVASAAGVVVSVVVGVALTIVTGGTGSPVAIALIAAAAGGLTTIGINYVVLGNDYDRRDFMADGTSLIVDMVTARLLPPGALSGFAERMIARGISQAAARRILAEVITEVGTGGMTELVKAMLDERTYQGTPEQIRRRLRQRVGNAALTSGVTAGVNTAGTIGAQRIRGGDAPLNVRTQIAVSTAANVIGVLPTAQNALDIVLAGAKGVRSGVEGGYAARQTPRTPNGPEPTPTPTPRTPNQDGPAPTADTLPTTLPTTDVVGPTQPRATTDVVAPTPTRPATEEIVTTSGIRVTRHADGVIETSGRDYGRFIRELTQEASSNGGTVRFRPENSVDPQGRQITVVILPDGTEVRIARSARTNTETPAQPSRPTDESQPLLNGRDEQPLLNGRDEQPLLNGREDQPLLTDGRSEQLLLPAPRDQLLLTGPSQPPQLTAPTPATVAAAVSREQRVLARIQAREGQYAKLSETQIENLRAMTTSRIERLQRMTTTTQQQPQP